MRRVLLIICAILIASVFAVGCGTAKKSDSGQAISKSEVEKVKLVYFHPRIRCFSCNDIEKYAKEVAENDFSNDTKDGKLKFESLQIEDPANKSLVDELDVGGSSLYLVVTGNQKRNHEAIKDVWLYWDKEVQCKKIIRNELSKYL